MKKTYFLIRVLIIYLFFISSGFAAKSNYFDKGKILFDKKKFEKSKLLINIYQFKSRSRSITLNFRLFKELISMFFN